MHGRVLSAMGKAVEGAKAVIVFATSDYQKSRNCSLEADYIYELRRPVLPIKLEAGFRARDWLGILLGSSLYVRLLPEDLSGPSFEQKLDEILHRLGPMIGREFK